MFDFYFSLIRTVVQIGCKICVDCWFCVMRCLTINLIRIQVNWWLCNFQIGLVEFFANNKFSQKKSNNSEERDACYSSTKLDAELITKYKYRRFSVAGFVVVFFYKVCTSLLMYSVRLNSIRVSFSFLLFSLDAEIRKYFCNGSIMGSLQFQWQLIIVRTIITRSLSLLVSGR